jgi:predicted NUDIX family NTP pyrophosphohydrolase
MKPNGPYMDLGNILQKNGKRVYAWAFEEIGNKNGYQYVMK